MNSKLIKACVAGTAAIAVAAGGTTFAAWSDFATQDAAAGAGFLRLNVDSREGSTVNIKPFNLAPGQNKFQEFYLASADSGNTPNGVLTAKIENLKDIEDGGPACTTNSEAIAEAPANVDAQGDPTNPLNDCGATGELSQQATVQVLYSNPVSSLSECGNNDAGPVGGAYKTMQPTSGTGTLVGNANETWALGNVTPGKGVCVRIEMSLPPGATNAVQGDDVTWNWRFDLNQA